jgi:hypothetical protein
LIFFETTKAPSARRALREILGLLQLLINDIFENGKDLFRTSFSEIGLGLLGVFGALVVFFDAFSEHKSHNQRYRKINYSI